VPRFNLPSDTGTVKLDPRKHAFTWAGCNFKDLEENYCLAQDSNFLKVLSSKINKDEIIKSSQLIKQDTGNIIF